MQLSDLIPVGTLGYRVDENEFIQFRPGKGFRPGFLQKQDIFLILPDHSVILTTVVDRFNRDGKTYVRFDDVKISDHVQQRKRITLALAPETFNEFLAEDDDDPVDKQVYQNGELVGVVVDWLDQSDHRILTVERPDGSQFMFPDVEQYIERFDDSCIHARNLDELMDL
jgi:ribosomal 30S subunit maturation factor RimM